MLDGSGIGEQVYQSLPLTQLSYYSHYVMCQHFFTVFSWCVVLLSVLVKVLNFVTPEDTGTEVTNIAVLSRIQDVLISSSAIFKLFFLSFDNPFSITYEKTVLIIDENHWIVFQMC